MIDWLGLPEFKIEHMTQNAIVEITVRPAFPMIQCPNCGFSHLHVHSRRLMTVPDLPHQQCPTVLHIQNTRFKCADCGTTAWQKFQSINEDHRMTERLYQSICKASLRVSFTSIAEAIGIAESTVRNLFRGYVKKLEVSHPFETPLWLGIDEVHLQRQMRAVFTNIKERAIIEMLPKRRYPDIVKYLQSRPDIHQVQIVTMDMWKPYREAVKFVIPNATIVVDRFHVVKTANEALEKVRKQLRSTLTKTERIHWMHQRKVLLERNRNLSDDQKVMLTTWRTRFPFIGLAYDLKEAIFNIYDHTDRTEAENAYDALRQSVPIELEPYFADVFSRFSNWREYIFNFFDKGHRLTNAFTESMNAMIHVVQQMGRGYSFEVLRARMLYRDIHMAHNRKNKTVSLVKNTRKQKRSFGLSKIGYDDTNFDGLMHLGMMDHYLSRSIDDVKEVTVDYGVRLQDVKYVIEDEPYKW